MNKYYVYLLHGHRIWSTDNPDDHAELANIFALRLEQRDMFTGTEYYGIVAPRKSRRTADAKRSVQIDA